MRPTGAQRAAVRRTGHRVHTVAPGSGPYTLSCTVHFRVSGVCAARCSAQIRVSGVCAAPCSVQIRVSGVYAAPCSVQIRVSGVCAAPCSVQIRFLYITLILQRDFGYCLLPTYRSRSPQSTVCRNDEYDSVNIFQDLTDLTAMRCISAITVSAHLHLIGCVPSCCAPKLPLGSLFPLESVLLDHIVLGSVV